jgi:hypothetical protein
MTGSRKGTQWDWAARKPHGTAAAYRRHLRNGDKPVRAHCPSCADAEAVRAADRRIRLGYAWFAPAEKYVRTR